MQRVYLLMHQVFKSTEEYLVFLFRAKRMTRLRIQHFHVEDPQC
jgi:hypothetical protein